MPKHVNSALLQLFVRESPTAALLELDHLPNIESFDKPTLLAWLAGKRHFAPQEICSQRWIKSCSAGYITELLLHDDGRLDEFTLFNRLPTKGRWRLVDGAIELEITKGENLYRSRVIANKGGSIHSAIEYKNDEIHAYLKLAQTRPVEE